VLTSFQQGIFMINSNSFNPDSIVDSILSIKASGSINDEAIHDLLLENGKSIAELLNDQSKKE
jgi:hypothetical protein